MVYSDNTYGSLTSPMRHVLNDPPMLTPEEVRELRERVSAGDAEARQTLVFSSLRYATKWANIMAKLWKLDPEECMSAAHEACLYCADNHDPDRSSLLYYVKYRLLFLLRSLRRRDMAKCRCGTVELPRDVDGHAFDVPAPEQDGDVGFVRREVREAIRALPPRLMRLMCWIWIEEIPRGEVAERLGVSKQRVQQLELKAEALLRDRLRDSVAAVL